MARRARSRSAVPSRQNAATPPRARGPAARRRVSTFALAALLSAFVVILAVAVVALRRAAPASSAGGTPLGAAAAGVRPADLNLLFITLDTTRADRLSAYGGPAGASPALDHLAAGGVLFEQTMAAAPLTLPSHTTMFTGMLPPSHGVRDNGGYIVSDSLDTLAEVLQRRGWRTGAFVSAYVLDGKWGLNQGFDHYFDSFDLSRYQAISLGDVSRPANEVVDAALPWLERHAADGPFFAWLHFFDPHSPYEPPEPYRGRFPGQPYIGEIAFMDAQIGRVLNWLDERGLADRTIVVAVGDHGESLGEHGESTHGLFIYDSTIRVPLIIRAPFDAVRGRRITSVVRTEDIMPTVLDLLHVPVPDGVQGRALTPLMAGINADLNLDAYSESFYARYHFGWSELRALRAGRYKYIEAPRHELYDMELDPDERQNVAGERQPLAGRLSAALARLAEPVDRAGGTGPGSVDPETRERLAALGYIGSFVGSQIAPDATLADPKDKIDIFNRMLSARERASQREGGSAVAELLEVVREDPDIIDAWLMLGNEYFREQDYPNAARYYREALARKPDYDLATINLANAYRQMRDYDAARLGYERYLEMDPKNAYVRYHLGEIYTDMGALNDAERMFREAIELDARIVSARNALGVVAYKRGDLDAAEREILAALATRPDVRLAHFNLALVAEARGDLARAAEEYRREIERHPYNYKAEFNLGKLHEQLGDRDAQLAAFTRAIERNPRFSEGHLFLAKLYLDLGRDLDQALALADKGLALDPGSQYAPLGHYVKADVYSRTGRPELARREAQRGRALEARNRAGGHTDEGR